MSAYDDAVIRLALKQLSILLAGNLVGIVQASNLQL